VIRIDAIPGPRTLAVTALAVVAAASCALPAVAEAASPGWRLLALTGPTNLEPNARQAVTVIADSGTFRLTYGASTTPDIPFDAQAATVEAALNALPSVSAGGGSVSVTRGRDGVGILYMVKFDGGPLAGTPASGVTASNGTQPLAREGSQPAVLTVSGPLPAGTLAAYPTNVGGAATTGTTSLTIGPLPAGIETAASASGPGWTCPPTGAGQSTVTCTRDDAIPALGGTEAVRVPLQVGPTAVASSSAPVTVQGGGAAQPDTYQVEITVSGEKAESGVQAFWAGAFDADGKPETQAGGHPHSASTMFMVNTNLDSSNNVRPAGDLRDVNVDLPPGFVGNPLVGERCPVTQVGCGGSRPQTVVGTAGPLTGSFPPSLSAGIGPVSSDIPPNGYAAQLTFPVVDARAAVLASLRSDDDYGVNAFAPSITPLYWLYGNYLVLKGNPAGAAGKAFLTNPTDCPGEELPTLISISSWQQGDVFSDPVADDSPAVTGCEQVPFEPAMSVRPTSSAPDSASGLEASIDVPQDGLLDPGALATSHLKKTVVRLPVGLSVNPSAATGLKGCSDAQIALRSKSEPSCPDGSKIGTVAVTSPLVDQPLSGVMYLGTPRSTDPMSGEMLRLFLVVRNDRYGLLVKLPGSSVADPSTGRLIATFDENPRVPFDRLEVELRGGSRGVLATPQTCGSAPTTSTLSPWSGTADVTQSSPFEIAGGCGLDFTPSLVSGMSSSKARGTGTFSFRFSREDGEQWVDGLTAQLPTGLLASVRDVQLCSGSQASAGACPAASRIGTVDATAGSGDPFVLERKGEAFLTEGYRGCPYGLAVKVPVLAGPFDKSSPETDLGDIVVRQAVCVDATTAQVSVISDPLPTIWHGIPLRVRSVTVNVDRFGFMLNPSDCAAKQVSATFDSSRGATAGASAPFAASGCSTLAFRPKLGLRLTGRKQTRTGKHPGVKATVTQAGVSEAGIEKTVVRLPTSLALDPDNAQALCEFADGTKPDLENHCPKGSIVGRARAKTPLLRNDLAGNVYFVKNVRRDPSTGNAIRTLPMLIVALRGEISVNLKGESSTTRSGRLVNTFASVPDAPITRFNLNIKGGRNGILAVTRTRKAQIDLCAGRHIAETEMDGHNGRRYDRDIRMKTPCGKKSKKGAAKKREANAKRKSGGKRRR
jgi:hypothetical protein